MREDGSPYYIGIAKEHRRPFRNKSRPVPPPKDRNRVRVIRRRLTWEEAGEWEKKFIAHYGLASEGGILRNQNYGGAGTSGASAEVRAAASKRMKAFMASPEGKAAVDKARKDPETTRKKSDAAKAHFSQPGVVERMAEQMKDVMNKPEVREKCRAAKVQAFEQKLRELGMTREEYDQTPAGKMAAASRRYKARLRLKKELGAS